MAPRIHGPEERRLAELVDHVDGRPPAMYRASDLLLYYIILYHTILCYIILYYVMLFYTMLYY